LSILGSGASPGNIPAFFLTRLREPAPPAETAIRAGQADGQPPSPAGFRPKNLRNGEFAGSASIIF
jgi:hypothetical protein